jgi:nitric oxide reductase activation protein
MTRPLDGQRAHDGEAVLEPLVRLEGAVRQQAVETDRHPEACDQVHEREHHDVAPIEQVGVPRERDDSGQDDERSEDGDQVDVALQAGHSLHPCTQFPDLLRPLPTSQGPILVTS